MEFDIQEVKCKNCGANLKKYISVGLATCEYCGTNYEIRSNPSDSFEENSHNSSLKPATTFSIVPIDNYVIKLDPRRDNGIQGIKIISAAANQFKKSYVIKSTVDVQTGTWLYYSDNYRFKVPIWSYSDEDRAIEEYIRKEDKYKKKGIKYVYELSTFQRNKIIKYLGKEREYLRKEREKEISSKLELERDLVTKKVEEYKRYGIKMTERIEKDNEILFSGSKVDVHYFNIQEYPVITPEYCSSFFPEILQKCEKYKDTEFLLEFVKRVVKNIEYNMDYTLNDGQFQLRVDRTGISWLRHRYADDFFSHEEIVRFHDVGMENIETVDVLEAVTIVIVLNIMELTKQNGKLMLDFSENSPVDGDSITFTWQERGVKTTNYKKW